MYLMETQITSNIWIVNLLTGGLGIVILSYLLKKWISSYEKRLEKAEEKAEEIQVNYNRKFREVNEKIDTTKDEIIERIDSVIADKMQWRLQQTKDMATIQADIKYLTQTIVRNDRDSRGREDRNDNR